MDSDDFLWHEVSEKEEAEIKEEAKSVMDSFSKDLSGLKNLNEDFVERKDFDRKEGETESVCKDEDFRKIMFDNAPKSGNGFVIAEKKGWREE